MSSNPEGIQCVHDEKDDCKHAQFVLSKPDIKAVVKNDEEKAGTCR
jgi:hypothetical protein